MKYILSILLSLISFAAVSQQALGKYIVATTSPPPAPGPVTPGNGNISYTISENSRVSIGVFTQSGTMVKMLQTAKPMVAGTYNVFWNGTDDDGNVIVNNDSLYNIKVQSNKVVYSWQGTFGNTSTNQTGNSKHHSYYGGTKSLAFGSVYGYYSTGYSEGPASIAKFLISDPNLCIPFPTVTGGAVSDNNFVWTDNNYVYWGAFDANSVNNSYVHATAVSNDLQVNFSAGINYGVLYRPTVRAISYVNANNSKITGLSGQKTGTYLFVARGGLNQLQVVNKTTGATVRTLTYTNPRGLSVDPSGNLWMTTGVNTIAKYNVAVDGSLSASGISITGTLQPLTTAVSSGGTVVLVTDGSTSQQVKKYNASTGAYVGVLGTAGGYQGSPAITNSKFYFTDVNGGGSGQYTKQTYTAFQDDGTYWIGDPGNYRMLHYNLSDDYLGYTMFLGASYSVWLDDANPERVFVDHIEFELDYNVSPFTGSTGWALKNNWGEGVSRSTYDGYPKYHQTLSNGRMYALLRKGYNFEVVEFQASGGLRFTGTILSGLAWVLCKDGSLQGYTEAGGTATLTNLPLTGFSSNNPTWGSPVVLATAALNNVTGNPIAAPNREVYEPATGKIAWFYTSKFMGNGGIHKGKHLAIQNVSTNNQFVAQTEKSTHLKYSGPFPKPGWFEIGNLSNEYMGGNVNILDSHVVTSFKGEFWKNGQVNVFNHYLDNLLPVGQFGVTRDTTVGRSFPGMEGNAITPTLVKVGSRYHIVHGGESDHTCHVWSIDSIHTINVQTLPIQFPTSPVPAVDNRINLMAGLPFDATLVNNTAGWTRSANENLSNKFNSYFSVNTSRTTYDTTGQANSVKMEATFNPNGSESVTRTFTPGTINTKWKFTGTIEWSLDNNPNNGEVASYFDLLDASGAILVRLYLSASGANRYLYANSSIINTDATGELQRRLRYPTEFVIECINGDLQITVGSYATVAPALFSAGDWQTVNRVRMSEERTGGSNPRVLEMVIGDLKFEKDY